MVCPLLVIGVTEVFCGVLCYYIPFIKAADLARTGNMSTQTGTVKFFNTTKGFGFIAPSGGGKDLFVHQNNVNGQINDGDSVSYDVENTPKGPSAINVNRN